MANNLTPGPTRSRQAQPFSLRAAIGTGTTNSLPAGPELRASFLRVQVTGKKSDNTQLTPAKTR